MNVEQMELDDYYVVSANTTKSLNKQVKELLVEGWKLVGSCCPISHMRPKQNGTAELFQTMVKYKESAKPSPSIKRL